LNFKTGYLPGQQVLPLPLGGYSFLILLVEVIGWVTHLRLKDKGSPYCITERRVPELFPVLGSQPTGD